MIAALPLLSSALASSRSAESLSSAASSVSGAAASAGQDFTKMLGQMSSDAVSSVKKAETMSVDALQGGSNLQQVVQAVMSAQENLQTALAVRDKSVAAFQEVTRMSI